MDYEFKVLMSVLVLGFIDKAHTVDSFSVMREVFFVRKSY